MEQFLWFMLISGTMSLQFLVIRGQIAEWHHVYGVPFFSIYFACVMQFLLSIQLAWIAFQI